MLNSLVLSVTYKCPIKCKYCGVYAGPHRKERMSLKYMRKMIDEVHSYGVVLLVVFTGGEPFLLGRDLYSSVEYAAQKGFYTRIVTNAYWARSLKRAIQVMSRLKDCGLTEINFSCDDFHQEFIPLENIKYANDACRHTGVRALIAAKGIKGSKITPEYLDEYFGKKLARFAYDNKNPDYDLLSYGTTVPVGWRSETLTDDDIFWCEDDMSWKRPCSKVLRDIILEPTGELAVCCGIGSDDIPEVRIGNTSQTPLLELLRVGNQDVILNWLALEGPYGIMRFVQRKNPAIRFRKRYVNICHLCRDVLTRPAAREILRQNIDGKVLDLSIKRAWLEINREKFVKKEV